MSCAIERVSMKSHKTALSASKKEIYDSCITLCRYTKSQTLKRHYTAGCMSFWAWQPSSRYSWLLHGVLTSSTQATSKPAKITQPVAETTAIVSVSNSCLFPQFNFPYLSLSLLYQLHRLCIIQSQPLKFKSTSLKAYKFWSHGLSINGGLPTTFHLLVNANKAKILLP